MQQGDEGPCVACPQVKLDSYLEHGYGHLIRNVLDLDFALQIRMEVPLSRVNYFEFLLLRILNDERNRYQEEQMKKSQSPPPAHKPRRHA